VQVTWQQSTGGGNFCGPNTSEIDVPWGAAGPRFGRWVTTDYGGFPQGKVFVFSITVPITEGYNMADLACDMGLPVLVVARPGLGTLNHSVLTVDYARRRGLEVLGLVVSNAAPPEQQSMVERTNLDLLPRLTGAPLLGVLTRVNDLDSASFRPDEVPHGGVGERLLAALGNPG